MLTYKPSYAAGFLHSIIEPKRIAGRVLRRHVMVPFFRPPTGMSGFLCWCALLIVPLTVFAAGQGGMPEQAEISTLNFEGNTTLTTSELRAQMETRETPGFFNKFLFHTISEKLGRKNEYLSLLTFSTDIDRLKKYYENRGFSDVHIDTSFAFSPDGRNVGITIRFNEGYRSTIDSLSYKGIGFVSGQIWVYIDQGQRIARGDPFNSVLLEQEVKRIRQILFNNGYPNATFVRDSSFATRYASTRNYTVVLTFSLGKLYSFGPIDIEQEVDSLRGLARRDDITDDILLAQLDYKPGDVYSLENTLTSEKNLNRLGILDLRRIDAKVPSPQDSSTSVPSRIVYRPKDKNELAPELLVSDENSAFNLGIGLGYTNRNFLGGARTLTARARFRTQTLDEFFDYFGLNTSAVSNFELSLEMLQPYIFTNKIKGSWTFSYIVDKQKPYLQNIYRTKFGITDRFAEFTNGFLDWTLEAVRLDTNRTFTGDPNDPEIQRQRRLLQDRQVNSIISFTIQRDMTNDVFSPSEGFINSATFEESGLLPLLLKHSFTNLPFTQFYRVSLLGRWFYDLTSHRYSIFALKLKGGIEDKYGESRANPDRGIPQTHRFFAGGSGSVRGWNSRDLIAAGDPQLGGNLAFEGSVELRTNLLQSLHDGLFDKTWIVQFVDFGNVWPEIPSFRVQDIAIAAGIGLRYDTFFGPFRIDWGFRVYNPSEDPGQRWIIQRKLFGQTFKEAIFHFGIGNAF